MAKKKAPSSPLREPEIVRLRVDEVHPWDGNPRDHSAEQIRLLQKSLDHFGLVSLPVIQKGTNKLIAGHGRLDAMRASGRSGDVIPFLVVDLNDEDAAAYAVTDNRLTDLSTWNLPALRDVLSGLDNGAFDMELTGFVASDLGDLFGAPNGPESGILPGHDPEDAPPLPTPEAVVTRPGDLYLLGRHRLLCGDSCSAKDWAVLMGGEKADLVITDPPYGVAYESSASDLKAGGKASIKNDALEGAAFQEFLDRAFACLSAISAKHCAFYVFYPHRFHREFETGMERAGLSTRAQIIWAKNAASFGFAQYKWKHEPVLLGAHDGEVPLIYVPAHETAFYSFKTGQSPLWEGDRAQTTVWSCARETGYVHPTQKPVELLKRPMMNSSKPRMVVVDAFGGSGSTMMTAEVLGRRCFSMELDPAFCDVIVKRWEEATGQKATRVREGA